MRDVERLASARLRDRRALVAALEDLRRQSLPLRAEHEHDVAVRAPAPGAGFRRAARARRASRSARRTPLSGTRKSEPIDARTAFGPVGSAQPSDSATPAPNASAARSSVPTFPGSATCQSASVTGRVPRGRSSRRKTATTRGGCASVETSASSAGSTSSPATSTSAGSRPARGRPRRDPPPRPRTARACRASAGRGACGRA